MQSMKNNQIRHIVRMSIGLIIALLINYFYSFTYQCWLPLATFWVMLTTEGSAIYQGIIRFIQLFIVVTLIFALLGIFAQLTKPIYDLIIGTFVGIIINSLFLPDRAPVVFRLRMIEILKKDKIFFSTMITHLFKKNVKSLSKAQKDFFKAQENLPLFVLETGFDTKLQEGHRYFLAKIIELNQTLLAMQRIASYSFEKTIIVKIRKPLQSLEKKIALFIDALMSVLNLKKCQEGIEDFSEEITKLEKKFTKVISLDTGMLDIQKDYVYLVEFIYLLKDLREILLKCAAQFR